METTTRDMLCDLVDRVHIRVQRGDMICTDAAAALLELSRLANVAGYGLSVASYVQRQYEYLLECALIEAVRI